jgi:DNA-binding transcriptional ArsR family regulator
MSRHDPDLSALFQALSDPTRRGIVERLARGPATVGELAGPVPAALPTVLAHLKKLEAAGLVASRKDGRVRTCALVPGALAPAQDWLARQRAEWQGRLDRLDAHVMRLMEERGDAD